MLTKRPMSVTGHISPYPTVVKVTVAQYKVSKKEWNVCCPVYGFTWGSTLKRIRAVMKMYNKARISTDERTCLSL